MDKSKRTSIIMLVAFFAFVLVVIGLFLVNSGLIDVPARLFGSGDDVPSGSTKWTFSGVSDVRVKRGDDKSAATNAIINNHATAVVPTEDDTLTGDSVIFEDYLLLRNGVVTIHDYVGQETLYTAAGLSTYNSCTEQDYTAGSYDGDVFTIDGAEPYGYVYKKVYIADNVLYMEIETARGSGVTATITFNRVMR